jgi:hypothetical protein
MKAYTYTLGFFFLTSVLFVSNFARAEEDFDWCIDAKGQLIQTSPNGKTEGRAGEFGICVLAGYDSVMIRTDLTKGMGLGASFKRKWTGDKWEILLSGKTIGTLGRGTIKMPEFTLESGMIGDLLINQTGNMIQVLYSWHQSDQYGQFTAVGTYFLTNSESLKMKEALRNHQ